MANRAAPVIRFIEYMGDLDDLRATNLIGPYPSAAARDEDLRRLEHLPLGAPEYNGGQEYVAATMAEARGDMFDRTVTPAQVASVATQHGFRAAFHGYEERQT